MSVDEDELVHGDECDEEELEFEDFETVLIG